jgi:uncharacterized protein (TIGR02246 family)
MPTFRATALLFAALFISSFVTACTGSNEKTAQAELERARVAQLTRAADETAIRAASAAWSHAATAKDLDKAVSFYAADALILPDRAPALKGNENIRKNWAPLLVLPGPGLSWQTDSLDIARSGDLAYETGAYNFVTTDKQGKSTDYKGKYLVIWKKQSNGSWKVAVDTDNRDQ